MNKVGGGRGGSLYVECMKIHERIPGFGGGGGGEFVSGCGNQVDLYSTSPLGSQKKGGHNHPIMLLINNISIAPYPVVLN